MKLFPSFLVPENKGQFAERKYNRDLCYVRRHIYEFMLAGRFKDYCDLSQLKEKHNISQDTLGSMINMLVSELEKLGWVVKVLYGETALLIYDPADEASVLVWGQEL